MNDKSRLLQQLRIDRSAPAAKIVDVGVEPVGEIAAGQSPLFRPRPTHLRALEAPDHEDRDQHHRNDREVPRVEIDAAKPLGKNAARATPMLASAATSGLVSQTPVKKPMVFTSPFFSAR